MKKKIHPKYYKNCEAVCACSAKFQTGSTLEKISTEICSLCHPFYTGDQKLVDSTGRVERFKSIMKKYKQKKKL